MVVGGFRLFWATAVGMLAVAMRKTRPGRQYACAEIPDVVLRKHRSGGAALQPAIEDSLAFLNIRSQLMTYRTR